MKAQRLVALFLLGLVLFNYPVLSLFSRPATVGSVPVLFIYLFAAWAAFIAATAWLARTRSHPRVDVSRADDGETAPAPGRGGPRA